MGEKRKTKIRKGYKKYRYNKTKKNKCIYTDEALRIKKLIRKVKKFSKKNKKQKNDDQNGDQNSDQKGDQKSNVKK